MAWYHRNYTQYAVLLLWFSGKFKISPSKFLMPLKCVYPSMDAVSMSTIFEPLVPLFMLNQ